MYTAPAEVISAVVDFAGEYAVYVAAAIVVGLGLYGIRRLLRMGR